MSRRGSGDPYAILEVPPDAEPDQLKKAYRRLARRHHPDVNPDDPSAEERFKEIADAFALLSDPEQRRAHDRQRGYVSAGGLPNDFLDDVASAIERAQSYAERVVLPHYAIGGLGAEAAVRLLGELEALANTSSLTDSRPGWWARRRAARLTRRIVVSMDTRPHTSASMLRTRRDGLSEIVITPWPLHQVGLTDSVSLDDALLRLVLARYAQILARRHLRVPLPEDQDEALALARGLDRQRRQELLQRTSAYASIALFVALLLYSGFAGW